jgi:Na+/H+ antiporter NhaD/arsenite permease-like protein
MLGSFLTLGVLSVLGKQPPLEVIVGWIDFETVMLLFGMMIIVSILSETGVFEWAAVKAYKISAGSIWMLLTLLCAFR